MTINIFRTLQAENKDLRTSNTYLQKLVEESELEKAKLIHSNQKLVMINDGYKQELDNIIKEADQNKVIETQQKAGRILLHKIDDLLSSKTLADER